MEILSASTDYMLKVACTVFIIHRALGWVNGAILAYRNYQWKKQLAEEEAEYGTGPRVVREPMLTATRRWVHPEEVAKMYDWYKEQTEKKSDAL